MTPQLETKEFQSKRRAAILALSVDLAGIKFIPILIICWYCSSYIGPMRWLPDWLWMHVNKEVVPLSWRAIITYAMVQTYLLCLASFARRIDLHAILERRITNLLGLPPIEIPAVPPFGVGLSAFFKDLLALFLLALLGFYVWIGMYLRIADGNNWEVVQQPTSRQVRR